MDMRMKQQQFRKGKLIGKIVSPCGTWKQISAIKIGDIALCT